MSALAAATIPASTTATIAPDTQDDQSPPRPTPALSTTTDGTDGDGESPPDSPAATPSAQKAVKVKVKSEEERTTSATMTTEQMSTSTSLTLPPKQEQQHAARVASPSLPPSPSSASISVSVPASTWTTVTGSVAESSNSSGRATKTEAPGPAPGPCSVPNHEDRDKYIATPSPVSGTSQSESKSESTVAAARSRSAATADDDGDDNDNDDDDDDDDGDLITTLSTNDVLCGRGAGAGQHEGNLLYNRLIMTEMDAYFRAPNGEKKLIVSKIVQEVQRRNGRFLERRQHSGDQYYVEIGSERTLSKVAQAFRDAKISKERKESRRQYNDVGISSAAAAGTGSVGRTTQKVGRHASSFDDTTDTSKRPAPGGYGVDAKKTGNAVNSNEPAAKKTKASTKPGFNIVAPGNRHRLKSITGHNSFMPSERKIVQTVGTTTGEPKRLSFKERLEQIRQSEGGHIYQLPIPDGDDGKTPSSNKNKLKLKTTTMKNKKAVAKAAEKQPVKKSITTKTKVKNERKATIVVASSAARKNSGPKAVSKSSTLKLKTNATAIKTASQEKKPAGASPPRPKEDKESKSKPGAAPQGQRQAQKEGKEEPKPNLAVSAAQQAESKTEVVAAPPRPPAQHHPFPDMASLKPGDVSETETEDSYPINRSDDDDNDDDL